ncbi:OCIA domain-containing protein 2 isoform X2 [Archocentrus centrarchus]|uniref:OCIA domain-containing protein 2 isoform X2 n=1 Tax=Archocentrus centrarchus TaxID=63155 RepID=UPI0011E9CDC7|nr:OCIA domain-containing protein 2 isoform X2 [Archocentrus centrarchus]
MSTEASEQTVKTKEAAAAGSSSAPVTGGWKCPLSDAHVHSEDVRKIWKECHEESFWYRALPLSLGSMAVTSGFIYKVAGILGYAVGKASYMGTCRSKFQELGFQGGPGFGPGFGPWSKRDHPGHRHGKDPATTSVKNVRKMLQQHQLNNLEAPWEDSNTQNTDRETAYIDQSISYHIS